MFLFEHSPHLRKEWDYEKNKRINPEILKSMSNKKVWWLCSKNHSWEAQVSHRCGSKKSGCPVCAGKIVVPGTNDLCSTHPDIAKTLLDKSMGLLVSKGSDKKVMWACLESGHPPYLSSVASRVRGRGCPVCGGTTVVVGINDLDSINPDVADELVNQKLRYSISSTSKTKVDFICPTGHTYSSRVGNRVLRGHGCPHCSRHGTSLIETAIRELVSRTSGFNGTVLTPNFRLDIPWITPGANRSNKYMNVDIYTKWEEVSIVIEYDGAYHSREGSITRDLAKTKALLAHEDEIFLIVRIRDSTVKILPIEDDRLLQFSMDYSRKEEDLLRSINEILSWLEKKSADYRESIAKATNARKMIQDTMHRLSNISKDLGSGP